MLLTANAWPTLPRRPFGGVRNWALSSPTKRSSTAKAKSAASPSRADRCGNGCLRITAYAERLLAGFGANRLERVAQGNAAQLDWPQRRGGGAIPPGRRRAGHHGFHHAARHVVGATYMVLAPEHALVDVITTESQRGAVAAYKNEVTRKSDLEKGRIWAMIRLASLPVRSPSILSTTKKFPVWIADYVLASYGTGAIMPCPDTTRAILEFARKFDLPVSRWWCKRPKARNRPAFSVMASASIPNFFNGLPTPESQTENHRLAGGEGLGSQDRQLQIARLAFQPAALLGASRSRSCGNLRPTGHFITRALPESAFAAAAAGIERLQTHVHRRTASGAGQAMVEFADGFQTRNQHHAAMGREAAGITSASPTLAMTASSAAPRPSVIGWAPIPAGHGARPGVDLYVGRNRACRVALAFISRFWHSVLFDLSYVSTAGAFLQVGQPGPYPRRRRAKNVPKSRGNVVNPDDIMREYGADAFRLYEMFMGPLEMVKPWNTKGVEGVYRFLGRVWRLFVD